MVESLDLERMHDRLVIDTTEGVPRYLLIGKNRRYIKLSSSAYHLLRNVHAGYSFAELAEQLSQRQQRSITSTDVETAYQHVVDKIRQIEQNGSHDYPGFWLRIPCLPESIVRSLARCLSIAFHPILAAYLVLFIAIGLLAFFRNQAPFPNVGPLTLWASYWLYLVSIIFHELGHASACARYHAAPGTIGFGIYWLYPVFYSDVSAAWQLKRWQRVIVDLGGSYFQLVIGACYAVAFVLSRWEPLGVAFVMIIYSTLFSLNPILKFDGYWVVADLLGVTNLAQQPGQIVRHLWDRLQRRPTRSLPWPRLIVALLILYTVLSFGFWGYFTWMILDYLWYEARGYPSLVMALFNDLLYEPQMVLKGHLQSFLTATFILLIAWLMFTRLLRAILAPIKGQAGRARLLFTQRKQRFQ